jgi:elongation factor Ts
MPIDAQVIKQLREETGAGVLDIKNALEEFNNDVDKVRDHLMEKGKARAASKSDRASNDGLIFSYLHNGGKIGSLVYLSCETDFVAKTDAFQALGKEIAMQAATMEYSAIDDLLADSYIRDESKTIKDLITETIAKVGENIEVKKISRFKVGE